jgi:mannose-1-phosphate guanylyltransferase
VPLTVSKAFLLAAGLGTRLRPLTDAVPKCLVPVHGKPLLTYWIETCEALGVGEVLINTHHLAGQVQEWAKRQTSPVKIHLTHEETLLGSAGTLAANRDFAGFAESFYIFYADNLAQVNFAALKSTHQTHAAALTLGLFRTGRPEQCGIAELARSGRVISFEEKPKQPRSNLAFAGVAVARQVLFSHLPGSGFADLGKDIFPKLVGSIYGCELEGRLLDIGTPENYQQAQQDLIWATPGFGATG